MRCASLLVAAFAVALAPGAAAQAPYPAPAPVDQPPASADFLTRYAFHLGGGRLSSDDERFSWDTHFGGDVDAVDYVVGRLNLLADFNAVLGSEFQKFDPVQNNYTIEASLSWRLAGTEVAAVIHHLSRHLSDRTKRFGIGFNAVEFRALRRVETNGWRVDAQATAGPVIHHDYLDYSWVFTADGRASHPLRPRIDAFAAGGFEFYGVDPTIHGRDSQAGGRIEGGVRLKGHGAAIELVGGFEQRVDAHQIELVPMRWFSFGFRMVNP